MHKVNCFSYITNAEVLKPYQVRCRARLQNLRMDSFLSQKLMNKVIL